MSSRAVRRAATIGLAGAAIAGSIGTSATAARPIEEAWPNRDRDAVASSGVTREPAGFDLPSAAIGAAGGTAVVILVLAGGGLGRRRTDATQSMRGADELRGRPPS